MEAFNLLCEYDKTFRDHIEFGATADDEAWLWAHDSLYIGYLLYKWDTLRQLLVVHGYREQGHGTRFVEKWFDPSARRRLR